MNTPATVRIREVGPRDGLQNEDPVSTAAKIRLIDALSATGLKAIEAVSFVRPDAIPQMADAEKVWRGIRHPEGVTISALVLNRRGAERALDCGADQLQFAFSASRTHNLKNAGREIDESIDELREVVELAGASATPVHATVSTVWGCPYEGDLSPGSVFDAIDGAIDAGACGVSLGDTTGMATPLRVAATVVEFRTKYGNDVDLNLHMHNTRGAGLANVLAGLDAGCDFFDASVGGLGGCPYAPGATGNVCTEDLLHMLDDMGIETGIDLDQLITAANLAQRIVGRELPGQVLKAGRRSKTSAA